MKGQVIMSAKETDRIVVLERLVRKEIKQKQAGKQLGLSTRQVRRLTKRYQREGALSLVHKNRGKTSNNKIAKAKINRAVQLVKSHYHDFGPTLAHEKLTELHGVNFSVERLRQAMVKREIWKSKRRKKIRIHQMRLRRAAMGELIQIDGSPHLWFEDRGPRCTLIAFVDDATGKIMTALFAEAETTFAYFQVTKDYLIRHGKMVAIYADKHVVLRVNSCKSGSASTNDSTGLTQYGRAVKQLNIKLIYANSPQAKGRVERLFETLQDRLVKEMRLKGINSITEGNTYLPEFIGKFNTKFAAKPRSDQDMHQSLTKLEDLSKIFTVQETRVLSKNLTCQHKNIVYQIQTKRPSYAMRYAKILVREAQGGIISLEYKGKELNYTTISKQARAEIVQSKLVNVTVDKFIKQQKLPWKPSLDHPWKRTFITN